MLRILLMLGLAAAAGVAAWQVWQLEGVRAAQRSDRARLDTLTLGTTRAMLDIRASQRAYLSPGQGIAFWKPRVDQHLLTLRDDLNALRNSTLTASSPAVAADDAALDALGEVTRLERRIAEHVEAGRLEHAADLVYADNIRASLALERAVDAALTAHRVELQAQQTDIRWREGGILALTALAGLLLAFVVMPARAGGRSEAKADDAAAAPEEGILSLRPSPASAATASAVKVKATTAASDPRRVTPAPAGVSVPATRPTAAKPVAATPAPAKGAPATARAAAGGARGPSAAVVAARLDLGAGGIGRGDLATPAAIARAATEAAPVGTAAAAAGAARSSSAGASGTSTAAATAHEAPKPTTTAPSAPGSASASTSTSTTGPTIVAAADLAVSMAVVSDAAGLQPLLARVADQLDAVGVIVWLQDGDGRTLEPALTHGYAADTLAHLGALDRDADNATARAFRTGQPQTVAGRGAEPGALVVPMQTAAGCVGVIAAELRHGREHDAATLALARIVAAQLAMLTAS